MAHRSVTHRFPSWLAGALCRGLLGAGFPLSFGGDAFGESTRSRWGHMDWADADSINRLGTLIDMMFYGLPLCGGSMLWQRVFSPRAQKA